MAGKKVLDAITLLRVTRNIAAKHFEIRVAQADAYTKTSSLVKALRSQTAPLADAVVQNFRAAQSQLPVRAFSQDHRSFVKRSEGGQRSVEDGLNQDTHYEPPKQQAHNQSKQPDLEVEQKDAARYPLPDGTIPPEHTTSQSIAGDGESFSRTSRVEHSQRPLADQDHPGRPSLEVKSSRLSTRRNFETSRGSLSSEEKKILQRQSETQIPAQPAEPPKPEAYNVQNAAGDVAEFGVEQEQDVFFQPPDATSPVLSALPRIRVPKIEWDIQGGDPHVPNGLNADVYYSGSSSLSQPSEEMMAQIFQSSRIARMLGKSPKGALTFARAFHTQQVRRQKAKEEQDSIQSLAEDIAADAGNAQKVPIALAHYD